MATLVEWIDEGKKVLIQTQNKESAWITNDQ